MPLYGSTVHVKSDTFVIDFMDAQGHLIKISAFSKAKTWETRLRNLTTKQGWVLIKKDMNKVEPVAVVQKVEETK